MYMANGSPLPAPRRTPSSLPLMPRQSPTINQIQTPTPSLLQPHGHHVPRESFETLTSVASSTQKQQLRHSPALSSTYSNSRSPELHSNYHTASSSPHQQFRNFDFNRPSTRHLASVRDLPHGLYKADEAIHRPWRVEADQLVERSPLDEAEVMMPTQLDFSWGSLYGFPYGMTVPEAWQQRAREIAEAEEAEYQRLKELKRKSRRSGRFGGSLRGVIPWGRRAGR